ncbi:hypothetical protein JD844_031980 [Phrynosoma platyrhinos]|uniref:Claudin-10 n=1 Tax=Phrynosoma platyrhinos TaxID=52577 RepID=A0ABQ7T425_PHRPL|nr:hypothetical protein JD844_031980 [Phrynosoma platyrhinos]
MKPFALGQDFGDQVAGLVKMVTNRRVKQQTNVAFSVAFSGYIQACRGLMIAAVCLGFFGSVFALVGMKCTKVGGSDQTKAKIACLAGLIFILCGLSALTGCSLYANRITSEFFDPTFVAQKYELGAALFIGWAGASLCIIGGSIFCFSIAENNKTPRSVAYPPPPLLLLASLVSSGTPTKYEGSMLSNGAWEGTSYEIARMGYAYNRADSVMSTRTKAWNTSADFKTSKAPPKHFDKNAYV